MLGLCSQALWISSVMSKLLCLFLETSITYNKDKCTLNCFVHCNF